MSQMLRLLSAAALPFWRSGGTQARTVGSRSLRGLVHGFFSQNQTNVLSRQRLCLARQRFYSTEPKDGKGGAAGGGGRPGGGKRGGGGKDWWSRMQKVCPKKTTDEMNIKMPHSKIS
ncbi:hypothetical protein CRENBAI_009181 [Crenichthys baileyi]|uniref:Uncharacterized protein n=1 Tax=Crenichthys baileyi TaxID=28760 RepID=A0AAV9SK99_9TELE